MAVAKDRWTIEDGSLTPSMKLERFVIEARYSPALERWYGGAAGDLGGVSYPMTPAGLPANIGSAMTLPIVLTHYGNADYLERTLRCASLTNPSARRILIGDDSNRAAAAAQGWQHVDLDEIRSSLRDDFGKCFSHVQGKRHQHMKNGRDWLRYVFERWYVVEEFCRRGGIGRFWHFDSDVLMLEDLGQFESELVARFEFTRQCNDTCLNGLVSLSTLTAFCSFVISLFQDPRVLQRQQQEFDTIHPRFAFTEMRAFQLFSDSPACQGRGAHLEGAIDGWWFDDSIRQDDDFEMTRLCPGGPMVKNVRFSGDGRFVGRRKGVEVRFATFNLSWVPTAVFDWALACLERRSSDRADATETSIVESALPMLYRARRLARYFSRGRGR